MRMSLFLSFFLSCSAYGFTWQSLWFNDNQKAEILFKEGDYSLAEKIFQDPAWQATAAYRAGDFAKAAQGFGLLKSEKGYYNQGNALAKLGEFTKAIEAYDKALALNPQDKDASYNRKLVQSLLEKQEEEKKQKQQQEKQEQETNKGNSEAKPDKLEEKKAENKPENSPASQNSPQEAKQEPNNSSEQKNSKGEENSAKPDDPAKAKDSSQAEKDALAKEDLKQKPEEAAKNQAAKGSLSNQQEKDSKAGKNSQAMASGKKSEKEAENQQWLKLIPDDPGGLLREKFLRDYLRRQGGWEP